MVRCGSSIRRPRSSRHRIRGHCALGVGRRKDSKECSEAPGGQESGIRSREVCASLKSRIQSKLDCKNRIKIRFTKNKFQNGKQIKIKFRICRLGRDLQRG